MKYILILIFICSITTKTKAQWQGLEGIKYCEENLQNSVKGWGIKMQNIEARFDEDFKKNPAMRTNLEQIHLQFKANGILTVVMGTQTAQGTWGVESKDKNTTDTNPLLILKIGDQPIQKYTIMVLAYGKLLLHDESPDLQDQRMRLVEYENRDKKKK
jgi:hypothetical protein